MNNREGKSNKRAAKPNHHSTKHVGPNTNTTTTTTTASSISTFSSGIKPPSIASSSSSSSSELPSSAPSASRRTRSKARIGDNSSLSPAHISGSSRSASRGGSAPGSQSQSEAVSDAEDDDFGSNSFDSSSNASHNGDKDVTALLSDLIEQMTEKRATTRITSLQQLIDLLRSHYLFESIFSHSETLQFNLFTSIKKGESNEVHEASIAAALLALTLGGESEEMYVSYEATLKELIKNKGKPSATRADCASLLAFLAFLSAPPDVDTVSLLTLFLETIPTGSGGTAGGNSGADTLAEALLQAYGLVATTINPRVLAKQILEKDLKTLIHFLEHSSVEVRSAAGENIAILFSAKQEIDAIESDEEQEAQEEVEKEEPSQPKKEKVEKAEVKQGENEEKSESPEASASPPSVLSPSLSPTDASSSSSSSATSPASPPSPTSASSPPSSSSSSSSSVPRLPPKKKSPSPPTKSILTDDLLDTLSVLLKQLSTDGNRHRARKERARQRSTFRDIVRTVEEGEQPNEILTLNKQKVEFVGWNQVKQLEAITEYLGKGLQNHFVENEVLSEIFEINVGGKGGGRGGAGAGGGEGEPEPDKWQLRQEAKGRAKEAYIEHNKSRNRKMRMVMQFD